MNIVLNYIPLKSGGGVQVGLDFLLNIADLGKKHNWYLVCTEGTPFQGLEETENFKLIKVIKNSKLSRLWFEVFGCKSLLSDCRADIVYTQFGPYWYGSKIKNVVGCAYSNLMYPELDFWEKLPPLKKITKKIIDVYRKHQMLGADVIIYETENLANRSILQNKLSKEQVCFVKPSPSGLVSINSEHAETRVRCEKLPDTFLVLLLSGYHPNKNIELLPKIAGELKLRGIKDIKFVVTLPDKAIGAQKVFELAKKLDVEDYIVNFEPVPAEGCCELYRAIDLVILPARLESFSNNIAESWAMEKPFMISDLDWARSICENGAMYFDYDNAIDAAEKIIEVKNSAELKNKLVLAGSRMLKTYPSSSGRFLRYLEIIESCKN